MITKVFRESVEKGLGAVVILAGSGSDEVHIDKIVKGLVNYGIPFDVRVFSAHKQVEEFVRTIREYDALNGPFAYGGVAGGTDALGGLGSFISNRPLITCSPDPINMSALNNPPGSSNVYVARPENFARFVAQMFSFINSAYASKLDAERIAKIQSLRLDDGRLQTKYAIMQGVA